MTVLHRLIFENPWWKLLSLLLAVAVWLYIHEMTRQSAIVRRTPGSQTASATFPNEFQITLMTVSGDPHNYLVEPSHVSVTIRGDQETLDQFNTDDVEVFVDLTHLPQENDEQAGTNFFTVPVEVRTSARVAAISTEPPVARIRQVFSLALPAPTLSPNP
jgi:YbbR domain-containing protein